MSLHRKKQGLGLKSLWREYINRRIRQVINKRDISGVEQTYKLFKPKIHNGHAKKVLRKNCSQPLTNHQKVS